VSNLVSLQTRGNKINAESVQILKDYLALAESGEIQAVAVAAVRADSSSQTQSSSTDHFQTLIGAVAVLQHRMIDECRGIA
jgi:hypothetical protein